ncbi:MAG: helix-turn-helix domain-containing protein [Elusimicrobia bacterium]|nr:helix-turn-helix domain-containing protein [Elusimicrobiota bacterium]
MERRHILATLKAAGGNKTRAAAILGISRKTLHLRPKAFGVQAAGDEAGPDVAAGDANLLT